jgi:hypothetical protein
MASIAKCTLEWLAFMPDLIEAAGQMCFISLEKKDYGAMPWLE